MGIFELFPPELITFLTWLVMFLSACAVILVLAVGLGKLFRGLTEIIMGTFR